MTDSQSAAVSLVPLRGSDKRFQRALGTVISVVQQGSRATVELLFITMSPLLTTLDCSLFLQQLKPRNINTGIEPDAG